MNRLKKILSLVLCVGLIGCSVLPVCAADPAEPAEVKWSGEVTEDPDAGAKINVKGNITIPVGADVYLDGNTVSLNKHIINIYGSLSGIDVNGKSEISGGTINNYGTCSELKLEKDTVLNNYGTCLNVSGGTVKNLLDGKATIAETGGKGDVLTAETSLYTVITPAYQWQRSGSKDGEYYNISGATNASYTLTTADCGKYVRVKVTDASKDQKREGSVVSNACKAAKSKAVLSGSSPTIGKGESKDLTASLTDKEGTALAGRKITLILNDKTYSAVTNDKGTAVFKAADTGITKLAAQTYELKYIFSGDSSTEEAEPASAKLTIELKAHKITVKKAKHGEVSVSEKSAKEGDIISVTVKPEEGYELKTLKVNDKKIKDETFEMPNKEAKITASFTKIKCKIKVKASPEKGGTVKGGKTVDYGKSITLKATAKKGYKFSKWTEDDKTVSTSSTWKINKVTDGHTYKAVFVKAAASTSTSGKKTTSGGTTGTTTTTTATTKTTSSVQTGDSSPVGMFLALLVMAVFGMGVSCKGFRAMKE